jgi:hypothetical protein
MPGNDPLYDFYWEGCAIFTLFAGTRGPGEWAWSFLYFAETYLGPIWPVNPGGSAGVPALTMAPGRATRRPVVLQAGADQVAMSG